MAASSRRLHSPRAARPVLVRSEGYEYFLGGRGKRMRAAVLESSRSPLQVKEVPNPSAGRGRILVSVSVCGVCRTDLHVVDGELPDPKLPLIPGHQIVGTVREIGEGVTGFAPGDRVGIPWLGWSCGECRYCKAGQENLCERARFTGYRIDGGFAEMTVADARYCFPLPAGYPDLQAAPLLCAGLIGYRALRMAGEAPGVLGLYGFGAAAHIIVQVARFQGRRVFAFTRRGDRAAQEFARKLGAEWAGDSTEVPPEELDAAIIFAPDGALVPRALGAVRPGGTVVCAGIHMSDIPSFPYSALWEERSIRSVANLTRQDALEFLALAPRVPVRTEVTAFPLDRVNDALDAIRSGRITGAAAVNIADG
jgi:propanol-preferring alcohol dehydrogenase